MSTRSLVVGMCAVAVIAACVDSVEPLPLDVDIQPSAVNVNVGDTINFLVSAQGNNLVSAVIAYDDGAGDEFATFGARTARVTFRHAYSAAGNYRVHATAGDAAGSQRTDSVDVVVK